MSFYSTPMSLENIFEGVYKLIAKTILRNLIVNAIIMLPFAILFGIFADWTISMFLDNIPNYSSGAESYIFPNPAFLIVLFITSISYLLFALSMFGGYVSSLATTLKQLYGTEINWQEGFRNVFSFMFVKSVGLIILIVLTFCVFFFVPDILMFLTLSSGLWTLTFITILMIFAGIGIFIKLIINWIYALPAIINEDSGVIQSFTRSTNLVRGMWWRTLGIILLLSIISSLINSILTTPMFFALMPGFYSFYFSSLTGGFNDKSEVFNQMKPFLNNLGLKIVIITYISYILKNIIDPVFIAVMYYNARAAKGEYNQPETVNNDERFMPPALDDIAPV